MSVKKLVLILSLVIILGILVYFLIFYKNVSPGYGIRKTERKSIHFIYPWFQDGLFPYLHETKSICPKCIFTEGKFGNPASSDAVVFHGHSAFFNKTPPNYVRPKDQVWIWFNNESPLSLGKANLGNTDDYMDMFNWTMTYRLDSDILFPYGKFYSLDKTPIPTYEQRLGYLNLPSTWSQNEEFLKIPTAEDFKDRRLAAIILSHCHTFSRRELLINELSKFIQVDVFGQCGNLTCDVDRTQLAVSLIDCKIQISKKYKFYLGFENTLCEDYLTEKYWDALVTQMVPIVYTGADIGRIGIPNSYINVNDFDSIESLAKYLLHLDQNMTEYLKYFEWRKKYWVQNNNYVTAYCALCNKLWEIEENHTKKIYHNVAKWFYTKSDDFEDSPCNCPTDELLPWNMSATQKIKNSSVLACPKF